MVWVRHLTQVSKTAIDYKILMNMVFCDVENMECMLQRSEKCPGFQNLQSCIEKELEKYDIADVTYPQWVSTDRTSLRSLSAPIDEFVELLVYQVDNLTAHSYTAKSQAQYLKNRKDDMDEEIIQLSYFLKNNFAENNYFIIQDKVQGYHWHKEQCTHHPVVIYYRDQNVLHYICFCFISDDLEHDTNFVSELRRLTCKYIKENIPKIKSMEYFSDDCSGQYKNFKTL